MRHTAEPPVSITSLGGDGIVFKINRIDCGIKKALVTFIICKTVEEVELG
jgi:hypothetical protein